jgi:hypothetical protein
MNRQAKLLITLLAIATATLPTGVAQAASSPAIGTGTASSVTSSSAVLHATVDPNGATTHYHFEWGPTSGYGAANRLKSAGAGTTASSVQATIGGLLPGTIYHYRVVASNELGGTSGDDRAFTTKGHPPPGAATGPATEVGLRSATMTGVIDPNDAATTYMFQYGLTSSYGTETFGIALPAGGLPVTVAQPIEGLSPGTVFHYRIVALHGGIASYGSDATFVTLPLHQRFVRLRARTTPHRDGRRPYIFTTTGSLLGAASLPASARCAGRTSVALLQRRRRIALSFVPVQPDCTFQAQSVLHALPRRLRGRPRVRLRVLVRFRGNAYVAPTRGRPEHVTIDRR